jgi:Lon protease-like protein
MTMRTLPMFASNTVLFPGTTLPLLIFEERYKAMFDQCMADDRRFGVTLIASGSETGAAAVPHQVGTVARIVSWSRLGEGDIKVITTGECRFRVIESLVSDRPYPVAIVQYWDDEPSEAVDARKLVQDLDDDFLDYLTLTMLLSGRAMPVSQLDLPGDPSVLSHRVASSLQVDATEKQHLLEESSAAERLRREIKLVRRERDFLQRLVSLRGVVGDLDTRWAPKLYAATALVSFAARRDGSSGK